jgi:hypothetical protein
MQGEEIEGPRERAFFCRLMPCQGVVIRAELRT